MLDNNYDDIEETQPNLDGFFADMKSTVSLPLSHFCIISKIIGNN